MMSPCADLNSVSPNTFFVLFFFMRNYSVFFWVFIFFEHVFFGNINLFFNCSIFNIAQYLIFV